MKITQIAITSLCIIGTIQPVFSQDTAEPKPTGEAKISIIALGPIPPRRYRSARESEREAFDREMKEQAKNRGGNDKEAPNIGNANAHDIPILMPPLPGEIPPSFLNFKNGDTIGPDGKKQPVLKSISVGFNNPVGSIKIPAGVPLDLKRTITKDSGDILKTYLKPSGFQAGGQYTIFMIPSGKGAKAWFSEPKTNVMRTDGEHFPSNNCRVLNYSSKPVMFKLGKEQKVVNPFRSYDFKLEPQNRLTTCMAIDKGGSEMLINTGLRTRPGTRIVYVFHDANPKTNSGKSVGVFNMNLIETPPLPTPQPQG